METEYTDLFKLQCVSLALQRCPLTRAHTAATLGLDANTLSNWIVKIASEKVAEQELKIRRGVCPATEELETEIALLRCRVMDAKRHAEKVDQENDELRVKNQEKEAITRQNKLLKAYVQALLGLNYALVDIINDRIAVSVGRRGDSECDDS